ncbi:MAG: lysophospholipid transporter LplT [Betaproteobacteria bacterium]|jgi:MFS family permease|nr:lysophospholipid transporter LplT [Betaproteobacteria bacterium]
MPLGFYIIMAAQFFSALADNAILILAIDILRNIGAADEYEPLLKFFFAFSYVVLAAFVGAFADSMPKWRVMLISNTVKIGGCLLLFIGVQPLFAYAIIGIGAAAYSPAKYGILTEYLPHRLLVVANGWIEGLTVGAIILGTVFGGELTGKELVAWFNSFDLFLFDGAHTGIAIIAILYLLAAIFNLFIPDTGVDHKPLRGSPLYLLHDFWHCLKLLWRDKLGQISLSATTLAWGVAGTLQVLVLKWAEYSLDLKELSEQTRMVGVVALGMAIGAVLASRISLRQSVKVLPVGVVMGLIFICMPLITNTYIAVAMLIVIGACGGFFVVPMNALLQHRGHVLMGAGHSIAVQNFNENLSILLMNALYAVLIYLSLSINTIIVFFGILVMVTMYLIRQWHNLNQKRGNVMAQLDNIH